MRFINKSSRQIPLNL